MNSNIKTTKRQPTHEGTRQLARLGCFIAAAALLAGCATANIKPAYPALDKGATGSVLKIDNTMAASMFALQVYAPIGLAVTVDGFSPVDKRQLRSGSQIRAKEFLAKGVTEVRLPAGNHTLTHQGKLLSNSPYYFNPVNMSFDTEEGKTYVIRFKQTSTMMKPRYAIEYEGWDTEQSSQWPKESIVANQMFGH